MAQTLDKDLNIIQKSGVDIQIDPLTRDLSIIQKLDDEPNDVGGLSAQELKAKFDEAGNAIKEYINDSLIPQVLSEGIVEKQRQTDEAKRQENEVQRQEDETARQTNETSRQVAESSRAAAESERMRADVVREEKSRAFMEGVTATAETISPDSEASAQAVQTGDSFHLVFGIPRGRQGRQGPPGPRGIDGVAVAASGVFAFNVNEDGDLILSYSGSDIPNFSINDKGELVWTA